MADKIEFAEKKDPEKKEASKKDIERNENKLEQKEAQIREDQKKEEQKLLEMSEISIWIDSYDDIFSDFDPRPYSNRSLSDDFLAEAKKASRDKEGKLELRLLISEDNRNSRNEQVIKKRLHDHFNKHASSLKKEFFYERKKGILLAFLGIFLMLLATYVHYLKINGLLSDFLTILLEPAGWFTMWVALDKIFFKNEIKVSQYKFYERMSKCEIIFAAY